MTIDWQGLKRDYISGRSTVSELGRKYGCKDETIKRRAGKEGWRVKKREKKRAAERAGAREEGGEMTGEHLVLWNGVKKKLLSGLESRDLKLGLEELKVAKVAGEVLANVIKGERQAMGMDENRSLELPDDTDELAREMESLTVPQGADEALDGK